MSAAADQLAAFLEPRDCGEPAVGFASATDHRAAVQGAVVGGESGVDFGGWPP